jgi:hypothetical protein
MNISNRQKELEVNFNKSLDELFEVYSKSEPKQSLPYVKPMNLKPIVSSIEFINNSDTKSNLNLKSNDISSTEYANKLNTKSDINASITPSCEDLTRSYGHLKNDIKSLAQKINILNKFENMKNDYVRMRDAVMFSTGLADFEKLGKEKAIRRPLEKVKLGIKKISLIIDKKMDHITYRIDSFAKIKAEFEQKCEQLTANKDKMELTDRILLCEKIVSTAQKRIESLNRSMWMCMPISEKSVVEKMNIPKISNPKKEISREM